jgi:murein L,D-transpeptidase YafK
MKQQGMDPNAPIFIRIFKADSALEVWKQKTDGTYGLLKTYNVCQWSGTLGPKKVEGDYQAPEGFYTVNPAQLNPNSSYYLSINIGYPNAFDNALGRTGGDLMIHGACSSAGCYSMTDESAGEIFALARDAFKGGQREFQIEAFPFRMTPENMSKYWSNPNIDFWKMLKVGYDSFELTHVPPKVDVCNKQYVFDADAGNAKFNAAGACPAYTVPQPLATALAKKTSDDNTKILQLVALHGPGDGTETASITGQSGSGAIENGKPPSFTSRFGFGGGTQTTVVQGVPVAVAPPQGPIVAATQAQPTNPSPAAVPAPTVKPATAVAAGTKPAATTTPAPASASDPIGVLIDRKFWWDDVVTAPKAGST